jgi:hypothetical protein
MELKPAPQIGDTVAGTALDQQHSRYAAWCRMIGIPEGHIVPVERYAKNAGVSSCTQNLYRESTAKLKREYSQEKSRRAVDVQRIIASLSCGGQRRGAL